MKTKGVKKDAGKPRTDLLSAAALMGVSEVLKFGADKYAADNWRLGMDWRRLIGAMLRHALEFMDGRSLRPLVEGKGAPWRDDLFLESLFTMRDNPFQEGIRTRRWKYVRMYDGALPYDERHVDFAGRKPDFEMLFDLQADPGERTNLATAAEHREVLAELSRKCAEQSVALNKRREAFRQFIPPQARGGAAGRKANPKAKK